MKELPVVTRYFDRLVELKAKRDLTTIVNEIITQEEGLASDWEFGQAMGAPSECYADAYRYHREDLRDLIVESGFINARILLKVIEKRTSYKFIYFSPLSFLFDLAAEDEGRK